MNKFEKYVKQNALSPTEVSKMTGINRHGIYNMFNGTIPTAPTVRKLSDGLGLTIEQVYKMFDIEYE